MHYRLLAIKTITKRNLTEALITPGFYLVGFLCLLLVFFLVSGFLSCIGSSGFTADANPMYQLITKGISGVFGEAMVAQIFSEGPFLFVLFCAFLPFMVYIAIGSLYKLAYEKNTGALELITYGPVDGTACFLAALVRNVILTGMFVIVFLAYCLILALLNNLVLGPMFFYSLGLLFFAAMAFYAYSAFISILTENVASGITLFLVLFIAFFLLLIGAFAIIPGYFVSLGNTVAWILQWFSPVYYWNHGLNAAAYGQVLLYLLDLFFLIILTCVLLAGCHLVTRAKGVRG